MVMRLWKKAVKMSTREKRMFTVFTLMYTVLIFWTSYSLELAFKADAGAQGFGSTSFLIALGASIFLTLLYAWIIVARNRRTWATLKCIGYTNGNINSIILGHVFFTTLVGFIITIETLFHYMAIVGYLQAANTEVVYLVADLPIISLLPVIITVGVFTVVQFFGYFLASSKITKVRPMLALKRVGE